MPKLLKPIKLKINKFRLRNLSFFTTFVPYLTVLHDEIN